MTRIAIVFFLALTLAGCAGNAHYSFGPNHRPMVYTAGYHPDPAEELDEEDVADVPWERCDGECRYLESRRLCTATPVVVGVNLRHVHAGFMRYHDRVSFRTAVAQQCVQYGGQQMRFAQHEPMRAGHRGLSASDIANLQGIAKKVLGPVPGDAKGYTAHATTRVASPAAGCQKVTERHVGGGTFDRWKCPRGTIKRLGW